MKSKINTLFSSSHAQSFSLSKKYPSKRIKEMVSGSVQTTINVQKGGLDPVYTNVIDPDTVLPAKKGLRYVLDNWMLGRLEHITQAQFRISELHPEELKTLGSKKYGIDWVIVQSVNASCGIEGKAVHVDKLSLIQSPVTKDIHDGERLSAEDKKRIEGIRDIYQTYIWALFDKSKSDPILSIDFILESHKRMFEKTERNAGKLKKKPVAIVGAGHNVLTLPVEKVELYLKKLCEEFCRKWTESNESFLYNKFLLIAEFAVDFLAIHPFSDGNGRMARFLSTYLLERSGYHFARFYPLDNIILENKTEYYDALSSGQKNWYGCNEDITPWIEFYIKIVSEQCDRAYARVKTAYIDEQKKSEKEPGKGSGQKES